MTVEETEIEDQVLENVRESDEYDRLFEALDNDYEGVSEDSVRCYNNQDESVDNTIVISVDGTECDFGSLAFGVEDGEVTKASATLHFGSESEEQTEIRDYRYIHGDEEFYQPEEEDLIEKERRDILEVVHYYQDK